MKKHLSIWLAQMRYSLIREMMFKGNFILWIVVELCWFALQLCFVQVIYFNVDEVAGWTRWDMILLVSTSHLVQQMFQAFFMINCMQLPELIRTGKLDFYLAQPAHPQFLVSTRLFEPGALVNAALALLLCGYAWTRVSGPLTISGVLIYLALIPFGIVIHYTLLISLVSLAFWMTKAQGFIPAYYNLFQLARIPREAFRGVARFVFTWMIPMLLVANVPARALLKTPEWTSILGLILATLGLHFISGTIFRLGLKNYASASS